MAGSNPPAIAGQTTHAGKGHTVSPGGGHGHAAESPSPQGGAPVGHHFNNLLQQQATVRFGMWLFLTTEVLFFGGAFCAYTVCRILYPEDFKAGSALLNVGIAGVNTFLLLISSLTITLAIRACYTGSRSLLKFWLGVTIILGTLFLGLKMREYYLDYEEGLVPTPKQILVNEPVTKESWTPGGERQLLTTIQPTSRTKFGYNAEQLLKEAALEHPDLKVDLGKVNLARVQMFFIFYYCITGLHVVHMIIGIGLLGWQFTMAHFGFFQYRERYVYVEVMSLYWHFVDMVWLFVLPLLYLAGPHSLEQAVHQFGVAIGVASGH